MGQVSGGMQTLLDTHAWLWWVTEDRRLSKRAGEAITTALGENALWLSFISVWEIARSNKVLPIGALGP